MPGPVFIDGESVTLRTIEEADLQFLQEQVNDPRVRIPIGNPGPVNEKQEQEFFEEVVSGDDSTDLLVAVGGEPAGIVTLTYGEGAVQSAELGYWLGPAYHEQGYGSEAAELLVEYGFEQRGLHRLEAYVFAFNDASQNLLEGLGFSREGVKREAHFANGEYQDVLWYGMLAEEWSPE